MNEFDKTEDIDRYLIINMMIDFSWTTSTAHMKRDMPYSKSILTIPPISQDFSRAQEKGRLKIQCSRQCEIDEGLTE